MTDFTSANDDLPRCFVRPDRIGRLEADFFPPNLHTELAHLAVSLDEARRWQERGWIPFSLETDLHPLAVDHLRFVRDVVRSGLEDAQIVRLMNLMPKNSWGLSQRTAYSFTHGWVEPALPDEKELDLEEAIDQLADNEDWDHLHALRDRIDAHLEAEYDSESLPE